MTKMSVIAINTDILLCTIYVLNLMFVMIVLADFSRQLYKLCTQVCVVSWLMCMWDGAQTCDCLSVWHAKWFGSFVDICKCDLNAGAHDNPVLCIHRSWESHSLSRAFDQNLTVASLIVWSWMLSECRCLFYLSVASRCAFVRLPQTADCQNRIWEVECLRAQWKKSVLVRQ